MPKPVDLIGQRFGRLIVVSLHDRIGRSGSTFRRWWCRCDCGAELAVITGSLRSGNTTSCGCWKSDLASERMRSHGLSKTPEYGVWQGVLKRCENPNADSYKDYGGRGIAVCERWHSFENFIADMGPRPTPDYTIERFDNDAGYEPWNCGWVLRARQNRNQRRRRDNSSGFTGVVWNAGRQKWEAFVGHEGRRIYLGLFDDPAHAAIVRSERARELGFNPSHGAAA